MSGEFHDLAVDRLVTAVRQALFFCPHGVEEIFELRAALAAIDAPGKAEPLNEAIPAKEVESQMAADRLRAIRITLLDARFEIRELRRANEILRAKVEVMELFAPLIQNSFHRSQCASPDVANAIDNAVKLIEEAEMKRNNKDGMTRFLQTDFKARQHVAGNSEARRERRRTGEGRK